MGKRERLIEKVKKTGPWFHQIDFGDGVRSREVYPSEGPQPVSHPMIRWEKIQDQMPMELEHKRILDLGCSDGFFSVEMARRGAREIVSIDLAPGAIERLRWAAKQLGLRQIQPAVGDIYALPTDIGRFDFVFMFALLYHLREPLLGLEIVSRLTNELYLETIADPDEENSHLRMQAPRPGIHSVPKWFPTTRCIKDMLRYVGFDEIEELAPCDIDRRPIYRARRSGPA